MANRLWPIILVTFETQSLAAEPSGVGQSTAPEHTSSHIAAAIFAGLPKYDPHQVEGVKAVDSPGVLLLPTVVITTPKALTFSERSLLTKDAFAALLRKRYPGASVAGQDPDQVVGHSLNYAALMYLEDKRVAQMKKFQDQADDLFRTGDVAGGDQLKAEIRKAFLRHEDGLVEAMEKSINNGRR